MLSRRPPCHQRAKKTNSRNTLVSIPRLKQRRNVLPTGSQTPKLAAAWPGLFVSCPTLSRASWRSVEVRDRRRGPVAPPPPQPDPASSRHASAARTCSRRASGRVVRLRRHRRPSCRLGRLRRAIRREQHNHRALDVDVLACVPLPPLSPPWARSMHSIRTGLWLASTPSHHARIWS
jgi:hypothetical protein